jgi:DNA-binding NtrC family response regulator
MNKVNQVLLVDNDISSNSHRENLIKSSGLSEQVKVAVNGGHALLYLDHISHKLNNDSKIVILLNMDTPIANGFDFLNGYKVCKSINKDNILIIVMRDNLCTEKIEKTKGLGVCNFIESGFSIDTLNQIVDRHFLPSSSANSAHAGPAKKERVIKKSASSLEAGLKMA